MVCRSLYDLGEDVRLAQHEQVLTVDLDLGAAVLRVEDLVALDDNGKRIPLDVTKGDTVLYSKYGGTEIKVDGEELLVLRESDVLAKVEG